MKKSKNAGIRRYALLHHDGSVTVLREEVELIEDAERERRQADGNIRRIADLSVIAEVEITVLKEYPPVWKSAAPICPTCQRPHE